MKIKAVMFDCDGTIVDAISAAYKAEVAAISTYGGNPPTMEQFKKIVMTGGITWEDVYRNYDVKNIPSALNMFYEIYHNAKFDMIPGAAEAIEMVKYKGLPISLVSHDKCRDGIVKRLVSSGAVVYFKDEEISCATDSKSPVILKECKRIGVSPENVIFLGDSSKDVRESNGAGCMSAAVINKYSFHGYDTIMQAKPLHILGRIGLLEALLG